MKKITILIITIITLLVWKPILGQVPMGEGYYYFDRCQNQFITPNDCGTNIWQFDNLARITFQLMIPLFGDNIHLYMFGQMFIMIIVYLIFYIVLFKITKNNLFSLIATILFLTNHTGSFSMMSIGNYQRFVQRVPNLIPIFISFYFLTNFFKTKNFKFLVISLVTFTLSIYLAHHSIFMLPLFIAYILIIAITQKFNIKPLAINLVALASFLLIAQALIKNDHLTPKEGIYDFISNTDRVYEKVLLQIPNILIPSQITKTIALKFYDPQILYPYVITQKHILYLLLPLLIITFITTKKDDSISKLYKASILALPLVCFLNLYAYGTGTPDPLKNFGEDRIYFIPSIFSSLIIAFLFCNLWNLKGRLMKFVSVVIFISFLIYNNNQIQKDSLKLVENSQKMEQFINYIKSTITDNKVKVAIVGPAHLMWPNQFLDKFYNTNRNIAFILDSSDWKELKQSKEFDHVIFVDYVNAKIVETQIK